MRYAAIILSIGFGALAGHAQEPVPITLDANRSCMVWTISGPQDMTALNASLAECPGADVQTSGEVLVRGSCTFDIVPTSVGNPGGQYDISIGGISGSQIVVGDDGAVAYRRPDAQPYPGIDIVQPGQNAMTFNTARLGLRNIDRLDVFQITRDDAACQDDANTEKRSRRRFIPKGLQFQIGGFFTPPGENQVVGGGLFLLNEEGRLQKVVLRDRDAQGQPAGFGLREDGFFMLYDPARIRPNPSYFRFSQAEDADPE